MVCGIKIAVVVCSLWLVVMPAPTAVSAIMMFSAAVAMGAHHPFSSQFSVTRILTAVQLQVEEVGPSVPAMIHIDTHTPLC